VKKSWLIAYGCLLFWGALGFHRFYLEKYCTGILYLGTGGLCGIGVLFDVFALPFYITSFNKSID
tara:strand:- start:2 stop:196 length:195 start_codon:yes stop_codon:yes gene_type:complete